MFLDKKSVLNPKVVLVSIAYFNNLRFDLYVFPYAVSLTAKALVSLKRVREFLEADEVSQHEILSEKSFHFTKETKPRNRTTNSPTNEDARLHSRSPIF